MTDHTHPGNWAARLVASPVFTTVIVTTIAVNAVVLGLLTYDSIDEQVGRGLVITNAVCLGIFVVELCIRFAAYWPRPRRFFHDGWNVFDLIVIGAALVPGVRENSTLLRIVRLLRLLRVVRLLPDLRVLLHGIWRSVLPLASIGAVILMMIFVYGMAGWIFFGEEQALEERWGNIGRAMLTLFIMLTLENFPQYMEAAMAHYPWAWIYFVSYILLVAFIVVNVLIAIVLNAMEEAREERQRAIREEHAAALEQAVDGTEPYAPVVERIGTLRAALDELELELALGHKRPSSPSPD